MTPSCGPPTPSGLAGSGLAGSGLSMLASAVVRLIHVAFVAFMALTPFGTCRPALVVHVLITPFLWMHWALNDDTCALTVLEKSVRGVSDDKSFFHSLVSPVYKVEDRDVRHLGWLASVVLWLVAVGKVRREDFREAFGWR